MENIQNYRFRKEGSHLYVPDNVSEDMALDLTTHLGVGAHPDDNEIMAFNGIKSCHHRGDLNYLAVTVTPGAGGPVNGRYKDRPHEEIAKIRLEEQKEASRIGKYSGLVYLNYSSDEVKNAGLSVNVVSDLEEVFNLCKPFIVYTHTLTDRHPTHVAVALRTIESLRRIHKENMPGYLLGCEVWEDLDWLPDEYKKNLGVSDGDHLNEKLLSVFKSQMDGGKPYHIATTGRRKSNAIFHREQSGKSSYTSKDGNIITGITFSIDMTPLIKDIDLNPKDFIDQVIGTFRENKLKMIEKLS
ncbi:MAG: PIG-L family deacetylase [Candidatus Aenigmarchaeota archaeon]|nr:PIG-L family deacetylase [Candidatus Aenigmarchaeota archaeon]